MRNLLGLHETVLFKEYNISPNPVDKISFDNFFIETGIAKRMLFKGKRTGIIHKFSLNANSVYKFVERFSVGITWYMMETKDGFSRISLKVKNENGNLVSFNGESITFRLSIKENKIN